MSDDTREILVLGGTGKTGRRVVEGLRAQGVPVRVGSTGGDPRFDWTDRATWAPAIAGMRAVYISYYPDLAVPGAPAAVGELSRLAVDLGVRRLVHRGRDRQAEVTVEGQGGGHVGHDQADRVEGG